MAVVGRSNGLLEVEPRHISEDAVLDVAAQESFLGERVSIFLGVQSPSISKNHQSIHHEKIIFNISNI